MRARAQVFTEIRELLTLDGAAVKRGRHIVDADLGRVPDAALVCDADGAVAWSGPARALPDIFKEWPQTALGGALVIPGLIEAHTHSIFAGDRAEEFEWRQNGQTYQEIAAKGGGILSTVRATRQATLAELTKIGQTRALEFARQGVTTLETKSGYGLDLDTELNLLRAARAIRGPRVVSTYLGAHARSPDFKDLAEYMDFVLQTVLPAVAGERLADRIDIYIEKGFFDLAQARAYFAKARALGLPITAHVDQFSDMGGTGLALAHAAQSVDHLVFVNENDIDKIARADGPTAVLLPASDLYLKMKYPPARALIDRGACVALSTDYNPGTSPTQSLSLVGVLARIEMKMSYAEVLSAFTVGAAHALGLAQAVGSLSVGKRCDFAVLDCSSHQLFYSVGAPYARAVYRDGRSLELN